MLWPNHIRVARHSSPHPSSRAGAVYLFKTARKKAFWANLIFSKVVFDFAGVEFVSRSFTDQFLNEKTSWENQGIKARIINQSSAVQEMFQTVSTHKQRSKNKEIEVSYHRVETMEELADYLEFI
jgi:anti-anti-sigma regulatory factor